MTRRKKKSVFSMHQTNVWFYFFHFRWLIVVVANVSDEEMQEHYDNFFEDVFVECEDRYGEIEEMNVCDNLGDHLVGNVYIKVIVLRSPALCHNFTVSIIIFFFFFFNISVSSWRRCWTCGQRFKQSLVRR